ncbi:MAG: hypothetical protein ACR2PF_15100, partial [Rhizobiaceae bacterium]
MSNGDLAVVYSGYDAGGDFAANLAQYSLADGSLVDLTTIRSYESVPWLSLQSAPVDLEEVGDDILGPVTSDFFYRTRPLGFPQTTADLLIYENGAEILQLDLADNDSDVFGPVLTYTDDGYIAAAYERDYSYYWATGNKNVGFEIYASDGTAVLAPDIVAGTGDFRDPALSALAGNGFALAYSDEAADSVWARLYGSGRTGNALTAGGPPIAIDSGGAGRDSFLFDNLSADQDTGIDFDQHDDDAIIFTGFRQGF